MASGVYTFTNLPNSTYKVIVEFPGFAKTEVNNVHVDVSQTAHIAVKLEVEKTGTQVEVRSAADGRSVGFGGAEEHGG